MTGSPPLEEIAEIEEEELVDPNTLVDSFNIDDPVRMYLKEIGKVPLLTAGRGDRSGHRPCPPATRGQGAVWRQLEKRRRGRSPTRSWPQLKKDVKQGETGQAEAGGGQPASGGVHRQAVCGPRACCSWI